jgi:hypothetical protein
VHERRGVGRVRGRKERGKQAGREGREGREGGAEEEEGSFGTRINAHMIVTHPCIL